MLREDNRYVPSLDTGFWKRTRHAIASTFVARNDGGHEHFAYSRFGSARLDYGNSNWDIRHRFVGHYLYELPFFRESKGILRTALGDWKLSGITTLQSGLPFNVTISTDKANTSARGLYRPNLVGTPSANCGRRRLSGCISTAAFEIPPQYTYGTAGRNLFHGPHLFDTDLSIAKNWSGHIDTAALTRAGLFGAGVYGAKRMPARKRAWPAGGPLHGTDYGQPMRLRLAAVCYKRRGACRFRLPDDSFTASDAGH